MKKKSKFYQAFIKGLSLFMKKEGYKTPEEAIRAVEKELEEKVYPKLFKKKK